MTGFTFVHAADLHLDAPFRGLGGVAAARPEDRKRLEGILREATFTALERLVELCIAQQADFLLLAGDVYNSEESSLRARLALRDAFIRLAEAGIAVFMAHGNHDPLGVDDGVIPWPANVTVFGPEVSTCRAFAGQVGGEPEGQREGRDRVPVALVSGISHTNARESRNLARFFKTGGTDPLDPGLFRIGLLHCSLADLSGGHDNYAPCTFGDLAEAGLDYWALGHVHARRLLDRQGGTLEENSPVPPLAAYSGSLQGLHVNEAGPHGCLLARVDGRGGLTVRPVPLAPVQWEQVDMEPGPELTSIPALEELIMDRLEALAPRPPDPEDDSARSPFAVPVRLTLKGRSPIDHVLRKPGAIEALQEHLAGELSGSGVFLRDLIVNTRPPVDMQTVLARPDLAGEALRAARGLLEDPEALTELAGRALAPLFRKNRVRKAIEPPADGELLALVDEAAFLCLDLLGPEPESEADAWPDVGPDAGAEGEN